MAAQRPDDVYVEAADEVFVRGPRAAVHPYLADVAGYPAWWPGLRGTMPPGVTRITFSRRLSRAGSRRGTMRMQRTPAGLRRDLGVVVDIRGALDGTIEWYYLDEVDGTVVHCLLRARTPSRGAARRVAAFRSHVRSGLDALKDLLEDGRRPGHEPDANLLAHQEAERRAARRSAARRGARRTARRDRPFLS